MALEISFNIGGNLKIPKALRNEVAEIAKRHNTTAVSVWRGILKTGLMACYIEEDSTSALIVRKDGEVDQELQMFAPQGDGESDSGT